MKPSEVTGVQTTHWLSIDTPEDDVILVERDPEYGHPISYFADRARLPDTWADRLDWVLGHPDEARCGLAELMDEAAGQMCSNPVGWWLFEDDEQPYRSGMRWQAFALVEAEAAGVTPDGCVAVCEECAPGMLYENANAAQSVG